jgi:branched-chain amino acid transport system substrate-binding protein
MNGLAKSGGFIESNPTKEEEWLWNSPPSTPRAKGEEKMFSLLRKGLMASILSVIIFVAGQALAADTVNIVILEPMSGPFKDIGDRAVMGVQFAVDTINASGGLLGKKVKLIVEDDQLKPDVATRKAIRAIMEDNAQFILQNTSTAVASALMNVAKNNKIIFTTLESESDFLTGKDFNPYFFRTCFTTGNRSRAYAQFFKNRPERKFYLINMDYAFGHAVADDFKTVMKKEIPDIQVVGEDYHPLGNKDFGPYITKILSSGAQIIFTGNFGNDLSNLIRQGAQMGVKARYATYFLDDDIQLPEIGQAAVGSFVMSIYLPTADTPQNKDFVKRWHQKFKDTKHPWPNFLFGSCYNGTMFLMTAIKKAKSFKSDAVIKAWEGMKYDGLTGKQVMRACDHQILMPGPIGEIQAKSRIFPFPFADNPVMIPTDQVAVPPAETGNQRCLAGNN